MLLCGSKTDNTDGNAKGVEDNDSNVEPNTNANRIKQ